MRRISPETVLEAGFALLGLGFVTALGLLVGGRLAGDAQRRKRHAEAAPLPGSIPPDQHQQWSTSAR